MTATGHAIVGAAIAAKVSNPWVAFGLIFGSHFLMDKLPHWDPMTNRKTKSKQRILIETILDVTLGTVLVLAIFVSLLKLNPWLMLSAAFVSYSPDLLEAPYVLFGLQLAPAYYTYRLQKKIHDIGFNSRAQAPWGVITQILTALIFIFWAAVK